MLSRQNKSILDLYSLEKNKIDHLFSLADKFASIQAGATTASDYKLINFNGLGKTAALLFFEASTRTRMSFETACARIGIQPIRLDTSGGTSLEKGETFEDTVLNVDAMKPSVLIVRCGDDLDLLALSKKVQSPILNAGWGRKGHPSQALLDAYTIRKKLVSCENQRLLIVGDVRHSRVASSHFELAKKLGYEVALCGPKEFLGESTGHQVFSSLQEGLEWATVAMALRLQLERHENHCSLDDYRNDYRSKYGFTEKNLAHLSSQALILHPGPINQGVEMDPQVLKDPRCRVLDQVSNGVVIRQSLIYVTMSEDQ